MDLVLIGAGIGALLIFGVIWAMYRDNADNSELRRPPPL
jgi:hypothetical protein